MSLALVMAASASGGRANVLGMYKNLLKLAGTLPVDKRAESVALIKDEFRCVRVCPSTFRIHCLTHARRQETRRCRGPGDHREAAGQGQLHPRLLAHRFTAGRTAGAAARRDPDHVWAHGCRGGATGQGRVQLERQQRGPGRIETTPTLAVPRRLQGPPRRQRHLLTSQGLRT